MSICVNAADYIITSSPYSFFISDNASDLKSSFFADHLSTSQIYEDCDLHFRNKLPHPDGNATVFCDFFISSLFWAAKICKLNSSLKFQA